MCYSNYWSLLTLKIFISFFLLNSFLLNPIFGKTYKQRDTTVILNNSSIDILFPDSTPKACILVLPGWNFPQDDICKKSEFCNMAKKLGYTLVMPNMQKSVYQSQIFPETRKDWLQYKCINWLTDSVLPSIEKQFFLFGKGQKNFIFGISTGGRGVALLAEKTGTYFTAGAALSGDYDQTLTPSDNLMKGYFGTFESFPERWKGIDNACNNADAIKIPLFLAHGENDKIVPVQQSIVFFEKLKHKNQQLQHKLVIQPNAGHNYTFWSSQYVAAFDFFESFLH